MHSRTRKKNESNKYGFFEEKKPIILSAEYSNNILYNLHDKTNSFSILVASR